MRKKSRDGRTVKRWSDTGKSIRKTGLEISLPMGLGGFYFESVSWESSSLEMHRSRPAMAATELDRSTGSQGKALQLNPINVLVTAVAVFWKVIQLLEEVWRLIGG